MKYIVRVEPLNKPRTWRLIEAFEYNGWTIEVGFEFDGASIPIGLRWLFPHGGEKFPAACCHDWGYRLQQITRKEADQAFYDIMIENGVSKWRAKSMYWAVRTAGYLAWKKNGAALKEVE